MDCSLPVPGSSIHGIFQARVLEWGAIAFSATATKLQFKKKMENQNKNSCTWNLEEQQMSPCVYKLEWWLLVLATPHGILIQTHDLALTTGPPGNSQSGDIYSRIETQFIKYMHAC